MDTLETTNSLTKHTACLPVRSTRNIIADISDVMFLGTHSIRRQMSLNRIGKGLKQPATLHRDLQVVSSRSTPSKRTAYCLTMPVQWPRTPVLLVHKTRSLQLSLLFMERCKAVPVLAAAEHFMLPSAQVLT